MGRHLEGFYKQLCRVGGQGPPSHKDSPGLCPARSLHASPLLTVLRAHLRGQWQDCPPPPGREELRNAIFLAAIPCRPLQELSAPQALQEKVQTALHCEKADFRVKLFLMVTIAEARGSVP